MESMISERYSNTGDELLDFGALLLTFVGENLLGDLLKLQKEILFTNRAFNNFLSPRSG